MDHPIAPESLARFVAGTAAREENRRVVAHLLRGCASCARRVEEVLAQPDLGEHGYDAAFERCERMTSRARKPRPVALPLFSLPLF